MPLRSLIVIALRMYAIYWLIISVSQFLIYIPTFLSYPITFPQGASASWVMFVPFGMFLIAVFMWILAARLAGMIVKGEDTHLVLTTLTRHDFYLFAFIFLGLYFILSSIAVTFQETYNFLTIDLLLPDSERRGRFLIPLIGHALVIVAGFACIFRGRRWTNKLVALDNNYADSLQKPLPPGPP